MPILPKSYIVFSVIPVKIPMAYFTEAEKIILTLEPHMTPNTKAVLRKDKVGSMTFPDFKLYYEAVVIRTIWYWHKKRHIG